MADVIVPVLSIDQETPNVVRAQFDVKEAAFSYIAGQFIRLALSDIEDPRGPSRFFSLTSSPSEKDVLMIATNITESPFKQKITTFTPGEKVLISGPFGKFILSDDHEKLHVFLAGGIGITPIRSIIKNATDQKLPHKIVLLYSNKTPEDIIFRKDLDTFTAENPNINIIHTITQPEESKISWSGRTGRIDEAMIREYVTDLENAIFYICGSPSMVEALNEIVKEMGISEENLKLERFTGYQ